jgi:hypothetical protein
VERLSTLSTGERRHKQGPKEIPTFEGLETGERGSCSRSRRVVKRHLDEEPGRSAASNCGHGASRTTLATMGEQFAGLTSTIEKLQRHVFEKRSEKMPPPARSAAGHEFTALGKGNSS